MARSSDAGFPLSLIRDKAFELTQIRRVLLFTVFFIAQSTLVLGVFYHAFLGRVVAGNAPMLFASEDLGSLADAVPPMSTVLSQWLIVMLLVNAVVSTAVAIYIRLRVGDSREFGELSEALNRALEQVHLKISQARELTRVIETPDDQPAPDEAAVRTAMSRCRDVLSYFDARAMGNDSTVTNARSGGQSR